MTVEEGIPYQRELTDRIVRGKYTPSPVRRVEIPKPDGGVRKLGIPTVIDRTIQQAIAQQLMPIYEPLFIETSHGYRPNKSTKDEILKVKEYVEQGYTHAVTLDLSKYFDTLNHELLINLLLHFMALGGRDYVLERCFAPQTRPFSFAIYNLQW